MVFLNLGTAEPGNFERSSQKLPGFERVTSVLLVPYYITADVL